MGTIGLTLTFVAAASLGAAQDGFDGKIDNTPSIVQHDKGFARAYLREKEALLEVLNRGDAELWKRADETVQAVQLESVRASLESRR